MLDHATILEGCARGERTAMRSLYDAEAGRMIGIAQRIVRRRDLAEEVVHDAFLEIWQHAAVFDRERGSARAWIYSIVRHRALNVMRDRRRTDLMDEDGLAQLQSSDVLAQDAFELLDETSRLRSCLEKLETNKRACLLLAYAAGLTHGEVAGRLNVPLGTAKAWVRRGLLALRKCMS